MLIRRQFSLLIGITFKKIKDIVRSSVIASTSRWNITEGKMSSQVIEGKNKSPLITPLI